ncbi:hypothetical protein SLA2020_359210 [Shorea laevis]
MHIGQAAAGARCPEKDIWNSKFFSSFKSEGHGTIRDDTRHRRHVGRGSVVEFVEKVAKWDKAILGGGIDKSGDVLADIGVRRWEAVGDGFKAEVRQASRESGPLDLSKRLWL